jgi:hypothetical protein
MAPGSFTRPHKRTLGHAHAPKAFTLLALITAASCASEPSARPDDGATEDGGSQVAPAPPAQTVDDTAGESLGGAWTRAAVESNRPDAMQAMLSGLRAASHQGWDRLVFELAAGDSLPGYRVTLDSLTPSRCGSGVAVQGDGERWLTVRLVPARAHDESGGSTLGGRTTPPLEIVGGGEVICDFEAHVEWTAPVPADGEFRVLELRDPARLVVDVRSAQ